MIEDPRNSAIETLANYDYSVRVCYQFLYNYSLLYIIFFILSYIYIYILFFYYIYLYIFLYFFQLTLASDKISGIRKPMVLLSLNTQTSSTQSQETLIEMDKSELENLLQTLQAAQKVVHE